MQNVWAFEIVHYTPSDGDWRPVSNGVLLVDRGNTKRQAALKFLLPLDIGPMRVDTAVFLPILGKLPIDFLRITLCDAIEPTKGNECGNHHEDTCRSPCTQSEDRWPGQRNATNPPAGSPQPQHECQCGRNERNRKETNHWTFANSG